jgi:hypothetical protein
MGKREELTTEAEEKEKREVEPLMDTNELEWVPYWYFVFNETRGAEKNAD